MIQDENGRDLTYGEVIQELKDDAKSIGIRLDFGFNYVTLYHGTSKKSSDQILKTGYFKDGFFFSNTGKSQYGDSIYWYAKNRGEQDGSGPDVLKMNVDPRCFHINTGTSEIESDGDLWLWSDGIWRNKKEEKTENYDFKSSLNIMKLFDIKSPSFVQNFAMSMLRHKYYNLKIHNKDKLLSEFKQELKNYLEKGEESPRWMSNQAKLWKCDNKQQFIDYINKFLKINSLDVLIEDKIKERKNMKTLKTWNQFLNESLMDMIIYDIGTWKYLMHQSDRRIGIIKSIESIRTGSFLKKKDAGDTRPNWYEYQDIRFYVKTKSNIESWHISKVLPLTSDRFYKLGGKDIE